MAAALIVCRFVHLAALLLLFGASLLRAWLGQTVLHRQDAQALDTRLGRWQGWLGPLALLSAVVWLLLISASMNDSWAALFSAQQLNLLLSATFFGHVWRWHLLLCGLLAGALLLSHPYRAPGLLLAAALALGSLAPVGHGAMFDGAKGLWLILNQLLHLLCAGTWLGGLMLLFILLFDVRPSAPEQALRHFSGLGYLAVAGLLASGLINIRMLTGAFWPVPAFSGFGLLLLLKLGFVLLMLLLALHNRRLLQRPHTDLARLRRNIAIEWLCGFAAVAAVSALGMLAPMAD